jgi:hypothetical protein
MMQNVGVVVGVVCETLIMMLTVVAMMRMVNERRG